MSSNRVYKPRPISGYPEWLPEVRLVEQQWYDHIRRVFESYGFCSVETPSVEELEVLHAKGEVDKEIYVIERLHKEDSDKEARLALHFDLTVPLARYVAMNFNNLVFPFKRYQMQRVWRGERPQKGRFREFTQCDIDVINIDALPLHFDAEMPAIIWEVLNGLPGINDEKIQIRLNNRKIFSGLLAPYNIHGDNLAKIYRTLDKREKLKKDDFTSELEKILEPFKSKHPTLDIIYDPFKNLSIFFQYADKLKNLNIDGQISFLKKLYAASSKADLWPQFLKEENLPSLQLFESAYIEGIGEIIFVLEQLVHLPVGAVLADLSIVRGLDYYTGTVYETVFTENPEYGSICSGGRYDDLASQYINKKLPGVGISIGFSRLFAYLHEKGKLPVGAKSPADVLMVLPSEEQRAHASETAQTLRARGFNVELYHAAKKTGDQIKYADRKGIPFVWFPDTGEVKCMKTGEQQKADVKTWERKE